MLFLGLNDIDGSIVSALKLSLSATNEHTSDMKKQDGSQMLLACRRGEATCCGTRDGEVFTTLALDMDMICSPSSAKAVGFWFSSRLDLHNSGEG